MALSYANPDVISAPAGRESPVEVAYRIEARVAEMAGLVNAANAAIADAVAELIEREAWSGYRSPEHWVSLHCGVSRGRARQLVTIGRRIAELPVTAETFRAGELTADQVAEIARRCPAERDAELAEIARHATVGQLRRILASVPPSPTPDPPPDPPDERPHLGPEEPDEVTFFYDDFGRFIARINIGADSGMVFEKAMVASRNDLLGDDIPDLDWGDALRRMSEAALETLDPSTARGGRPYERYQAIVHVDGESLNAQPHLGSWLPPKLASYLTCDASMRLAVHDAVNDAADRLLGITPSAPVVDPKLRAVIEHRDRGCRVPGCAAQRWLHIHHIIHREHGGKTIPGNLIALCRYHHRQHRLGLLGMEGDPEVPGGMRFTDKWGRDIEAKPPTPPPKHRPLAATAADLGIPDGSGWVHPWGTPIDARAFAWNDVPEHSKDERDEDDGEGTWDPEWYDD